MRLISLLLDVIKCLQVFQVFIVILNNYVYISTLILTPQE